MTRGERLNNWFLSNQWAEWIVAALMVAVIVISVVALVLT